MYEWVSKFVTMDNVRDILGTNLGMKCTSQYEHRFKDRVVAHGAHQDRQDIVHRRHQQRRMMSMTQEQAKQPEPLQERINYSKMPKLDPNKP